MQWVVTSANISKSYTSITWKREGRGVEQTLTVMAWDNGDMTLFGRSVWEGVTVETTSGHPREHIMTDDAITHYFNKTMFQGDVV